MILTNSTGRQVSDIPLTCRRRIVDRECSYRLCSTTFTDYGRGILYCCDGHGAKERYARAVGKAKARRAK